MVYQALFEPVYEVQAGDGNGTALLMALVSPVM
jgi:hypothetical protein